MHRILVVGASSRTGRQLVKQAVERGHEVTAFLRDPAKAASLPPNVEKVTGDALDANAIAGAVAGHDTIMVAIGDRKVHVSAATIRNVIAGMKSHGVKRVILLSAYGTGDSGHGVQGFLFRTMLGKLNADKVEADRLLEESGLDWTSVRAPALTEGPKAGRIKAATDVVINGFKGMSRADLAAFMLDEMDANAFVRRKPIVAAA